MELLCYLYEGWDPRIRPATSRRDWMDATPEAFAYRCLPLNIANAHGWEILSPCSFEAEWTGGSRPEDVRITADAGANPLEVPVALFGQGVITFHIQALFRTPPGWNLWVGGPPNSPRDGIAPLGGVIETDWSPYTFTMNWQFTRPGHRIRFEAGDVICHLFPVERDTVESVTPRFLPIESEPDLKQAFEAWSASREAFQAEVALNPPSRPADKWQKLYYRGVMPDGSPGPGGHQSKLRPADFGSGGSRATCPVSPQVRDQTPQIGTNPLALARRDWLLTAQSRLRSLSARASGLMRFDELTPEAFLDQFYAANRPVVLGTLSGLLEPGTNLAHEAEGDFTPLNQAITNSLKVQVSGSSQIALVAPSETPRLYNSRDALSDIEDLLAPDLDLAAYPLAQGLNVQALTLAPGDVLFIPVGWWHQVRALEAGASLICTQFPWPNASGADYPLGDARTD